MGAADVMLTSSARLVGAVFLKMQRLHRLKSVFTKLRQYNLKLKASKCELFRHEVLYLGHVVSEEGIKTDFCKD